MNILEKKQRINYEDVLKKLILHLQIGSNPIELLGSAGLAIMRYPSDYDLYSKINKKPKIKTLYNTLNEILDYLEDIPKMKVIETKYQLTNDNKKKYYKNDRISYSDLYKIYDDLDIIKIDMIYELDYNLKEISIIYDFSNKKKNYEKDLIDDIKELEKTGEYFKILKRIFSIEKYRETLGKGNEKLMLSILNILNSDLGKRYSELKSLELEGKNIDKEMKLINGTAKNFLFSK